MEDAALITAWATVAIMIVTGSGAAATCFLIWRGIVEMRRSSDQRAADRAEARKAREEAREADLRRHKEAMDEGLRQHDEAMAGHAATLEALRALIERMAPASAGRAKPTRRLAL